MTPKQIIEKCEGLSVYEKRSLEDGYSELVFYSKEANEWNRVVVDILGPAVKPAGVKPSQDHQNVTKEYGGIHANQTLFKKEYGDFSVIAMFWPWQDGIYVTLKIAVLTGQC